MRRKIGTTKRRRSTSTKRRAAPRRRRRISGTGDVMGMAMKAVGLGAGGVAGRELEVIAKKVIPTLSPIITGFIQMAAGLVLPMVIKGNKFVADMGDGIVAIGFVSTLKSLGVINGIGDGSVMTYRINGTNGGRIRTIAGGANMSAIAGGANMSAIAGNALPYSSRTRSTNNGRPSGETMYS